MKILPKKALIALGVVASFTAVIVLLVITEVIQLSFSLSPNKEIKGAPKPVSKFLDQGDLDKLEAQGFEVIKGKNPPNIEGTFFSNSGTTLYDKIGDYAVGDTIWDYAYTFANQTGDGAVDVSYVAVAEDGKDVANGLGAFISGDNGCFTVYVDLKGTLNGCDYKSPQVISGCMIEAGVENWKNSFLMKDRTRSAFCDDEMTEIGNFRIFEESDGIAERQ